MDEGEGAIETVSDKEAKLEKLFEDFKGNIAHNAERKMIFQVNGLLAEDGKFDEPVVSELIGVLHNQLSNIEETEIPLQWYALEIVLQESTRSTKCKVVSREECNRIAESLQMNARETLEALKFLSCLNIIHYYPDVLENVVFTNPQVILGMLFDLTEKVYKILPPQPEEPTLCGACKDLKNGEVMMNVIGDLLKPHCVPGLLGPEDSVNILERLYVVARLDDNRCFMPALLTSLPPQKLDKLRNPEHQPLLYHFKSGPGPAGLFCALVVYLISKKEWSVCYKKKPSRGILECDDPPWTGHACYSHHC